MVQCEHCGRQFNPHSAARHIPWCAKQQSENKKHRLSNEKQQALERYKWRISYRPSNQIRATGNQQQQQQQQQRQRPTTLANGGGMKHSSVNSSTTLSSPSASSSASIGTSVTSGSVANNQRHRTQPSKASQLKRSVSSLTLTKQTGTASCSQKKSSHTQSNRLPQSQTVHKRTKSVSNLDDMGEMVETLAKRVDEIYAQNQLLLANISIRNLQANGRSHTKDDGRSVDTLSDNDDGELTQIECYHCKSSCLADANYCHKCGCKQRAQLQDTSTPSSPG